MSNSKFMNTMGGIVECKKSTDGGWHIEYKNRKNSSNSADVVFTINKPDEYLAADMTIEVINDQSAKEYVRILKAIDFLIHPDDLVFKKVPAEYMTKNSNLKTALTKMRYKKAGDKSSIYEYERPVTKWIIIWTILGFTGGLATGKDVLKIVLPCTVIGFVFGVVLYVIARKKRKKLKKSRK